MRGAIGFFSLIGILIYFLMLLMAVVTKRQGKKSYLAGILIAALIFTGNIYMPTLISDRNKKAGETEETQNISLEVEQNDKGISEPTNAETQHGEKTKPGDENLGEKDNSPSEGTVKDAESRDNQESGWQYSVSFYPNTDLELTRLELTEFNVSEFKDGKSRLAEGVQWSLEGDIGTLATNVNNPVMFTAEKVGQGTVRARFGDKEYSWKVVVKPIMRPLNLEVTGKGRVIKNPDKELYEEGEVVTLTALPDSGWDLFNWEYVRSPEFTGGTKQITINRFNNSAAVVFSEIITFPDKAFENVIRRYTGKKSGNILAEDVKYISSLQADSAGIISLEGIQNLPKLTKVELTYNKISDLGPLAGCTKITDIYMDGNPVTSLSPLRDMKALVNLRIVDGNVSSISGISSLTNLKSLCLSYNKIGDITALSRLTNLEALYLNNNNISNIEPLRNLNKLTSLYLSSNNIIDYSPVKDFYSNIRNKDFQIP